MNTILTDVLVIGGGAAACRAAIEANKLDVKVMIIDKGLFGHSGATAYHRIARFSAYMAGISNTVPQNTLEDHYNGVMKSGHGMADKDLVQILANEAPERFRELEMWGMKFIKGEEGYKKFTEKSPLPYKKTLLSLTTKGEELLHVLVKQVKERDIKLIEETMVVDLLVTNGICTGVVAVNKKGNISIIEAKSVIVTSGGGGQLFLHSFNPPELTGDGYAMGLRVGAKFMNMEFMQIGIGIVNARKKFLLGHEVWGLFPRIYNKHNEEFVKDYLPEDVSLKQCLTKRSNDFPYSIESSAKWIDISIFKELQKGNGTNNKGIYVDFSNIDIKSSVKFERAYGTLNWLQKQGVDVKKQAIEVAPCHHAFNGGYVINNKAETSIPGLFAAGEVTGGAHGADRPGGHMFAVTQVLGAKAGYHAAIRAKKIRYMNINIDQTKFLLKQANDLLKCNGDIDIKEVKNEVQRVMWENVLTLRNEKDLIDTFKRLSKIEHDTLTNICTKDSHPFTPIEIRNLLAVGKLVTIAALLRRESRGSHFREDYPESDINQAKPINMDNSMLFISEKDVYANKKNWKRKINNF